MLDRPFPFLLDDQLTRMACIVMLISGIAYRLLDWTVVGWLGLILSIQILFLAHHVALASPVDEEFEVSLSFVV